MGKNKGAKNPNCYSNLSESALIARAKDQRQPLPNRKKALACLLNQAGENALTVQTQIGMEAWLDLQEVKKGKKTRKKFRDIFRRPQ